MGYWRWIDTGPYYGVPTANFVAWAVTGLVMGAITLKLIEPTAAARPSAALPFVPALLYVLNIVQFTLVDLVNGYTLAGLLGVAALLAGGLYLTANTNSSPLAAWLPTGRWRSTGRIESEQ